MQALISHFGQRYATGLIEPEADHRPEARFPCGGRQFKVPLSAGLAPGRDLRVTWRVFRLLRQARPGLLHIHGYKAALIGCPAAAAARVPALVTIHNYPAYRGSGYLLPPLMRLMGAADTRFIAVSHALCRDITAWGIPPERVTVIHNGIDPSPFEPAGLSRGAGAAAGKRLVVGTVARLAPQKGLPYLLRAAAALAARFPRMHFEIAGDGPERGRLQETARQIGLGGRLEFTGFCTDLPERLSRMDIFVLSSLTEGLAVILMEALAAGCAVVATRVGGVCEVIEDGVTGLLVPPADSFALAEAIRTLAENPALARRLARAGQARVRRHFSLEKMLSETAAVYDSILVSPPLEKGKPDRNPPL